MVDNASGISYQLTNFHPDSSEKVLSYSKEEGKIVFEIELDSEIFSVTYDENAASQLGGDAGTVMNSEFGNPVEILHSPLDGIDPASAANVITLSSPLDGAENKNTSAVTLREATDGYDSAAPAILSSPLDALQ